MTLVVPPASNGGVVHGSAHLIVARRANHAPILVEAQTPIVPWQADELDQFPRIPLGLRDEFLITNIQDGHADDAPQALHHLSVYAVERHEIPQSGSICLRVVQRRGVAGEAGIERVTHAMNDPRAGEEQVDQPDVEKVLRHLVDHARGASSQLAKFLQMELRQTVDVLLGQGSNALWIRNAPREFQ